MGDYSFLIPIIFVIDIMLYMATPDRHPEEYKFYSLWRVLPLSGYVLYFRYRLRRNKKDPQ